MMKLISSAVILSFSTMASTMASAAYMKTSAQWYDGTLTDGSTLTAIHNNVNNDGKFSYIHWGGGSTDKEKHDDDHAKKDNDDKDHDKKDDDHENEDKHSADNKSHDDDDHDSNGNVDHDNEDKKHNVRDDIHVKKDKEHKDEDDKYAYISDEHKKSDEDHDKKDRDHKKEDDDHSSSSSHDSDDDKRDHYDADRKHDDNDRKDDDKEREHAKSDDTDHFGDDKQSYYTFDGVDTNIDDYLTNNEAFSLGTFGHINNPITGATLTDVKLNLSLMSTLFSGVNYNLSFTHEETPNTGVCAYGNSSDTKCPDKVTLDVLSDNKLIAYNGDFYKLNIYGFSETASGTSTSEFITQEKSTNQTQIWAQFAKVTGSTPSVPEPTPLALMSLGLLGFLARKKFFK